MQEAPSPFNVAIFRRHDRKDKPDWRGKDAQCRGALLDCGNELLPGAEATKERKYIVPQGGSNFVAEFRDVRVAVHIPPEVRRRWHQAANSYIDWP
jgi:hypothetical protein